MGINTATPSLSSALFSGVQSRVLAILFGQPDDELQITEVISRAGSGRGAVQRELAKLTATGIVSIIRHGNRKLYRANRESPIFSELHQLILKTVGVVEPLRDALAGFRDAIFCAFVYGSVAKQTDTAKSDIDVMIIGDGLSYSDIYEALQKPESILARPINPTLMTRSEWRRKLGDGTAFLVRVLEQPKLFILGSDDELRALG